jgi:hypothetical protein
MTAEQIGKGLADGECYGRLGGKIGFLGASPVEVQEVTDLESLITALEKFGFVYRPEKEEGK